jgi:uncharacterized membrane protein
VKRPITLSAAILAFMIALSIGVPVWADTVKPAVVVQAGADSQLAFSIGNDTDAAHTYTLSTTGLPSGATATFAQDGPLVTSVKADAHGSAPVTIRLQVPADTRLSRTEVTFVAKRDDGVTAETPFFVDVESRFALKITGATKNVSVFSGQDFSTDVVVTNAGAGAVTNVKPSVEMPPKWVLLLDPPSVPSIAPGKDAVFHLKITVPASQAALVQPVKVAATGDQASSPASSMSVRVQTNPAYLPVAAVAVLAALLGVFIYFRRKGRR